MASLKEEKVKIKLSFPFFMFGYNGKILRVDLSAEKVSEERLDEKILRKFMVMPLLRVFILQHFK